MILAFVMLFIGGLLLGGVWSFFRSKKPWWATAGVALGAVICIAISVWRIQTG